MPTRPKHARRPSPGSGLPRTWRSPASPVTAVVTRPGRYRYLAGSLLRFPRLAVADAPACREDRMRKWQCIVCGWIYDEAEGFDEDGIPPGTPWEDIPEDFICPECGVGKEDFEMIEIG